MLQILRALHAIWLRQAPLNSLCGVLRCLKFALGGRVTFQSCCLYSRECLGEACKRRAEIRQEIKHSDLFLLICYGRLLSVAVTKACESASQWSISLSRKPLRLWKNGRWKACQCVGVGFLLFASLCWLPYTLAPFRW